MGRLVTLMQRALNVPGLSECAVDRGAAEERIMTPNPSLNPDASPAALRAVCPAPVSLVR